MAIGAFALEGAIVGPCWRWNDAPTKDQEPGGYTRSMRSSLLRKRDRPSLLETAFLLPLFVTIVCNAVKEECSI